MSFKWWMLFILWLLVTASHFSESLIYPFGSRPSDTVVSSVLSREQPLTVSVLIEISQMTNLSVTENFTLCFNVSNNMELKMFHELKNEEKTISIEMGKMLSIDIRNIYWIENENVTCMVIENASFVKLEHAPSLTTNDIIRVITLSTISVISLGGNLAVLTTIALNRRRRQSTIYLLIGMLAIADLLVTISCVIADAIWAYTVEWMADNTTCKLVKFFQMFSLYFSTFLLLVIGYDRYYAVKFPMRRADSRKKIQRMLIAIAVLSAIFSSPQAIIFRVVKGPFIEDFYQCVTYGFYTEEWQEQLYTTASLVLMFLLPLFILMFTYICTFYTIAKKENSFSDHPNEAMNEVRRNLLRKAKTKALMITVVIMVAFVICWAPYYSTMIIFIFLKPNSQLSQDLQSAVFFFGSSTAMINPLIYGAFHLRRGTPRHRVPTHSSGSSKAENTVMQLVVRKKRIGSEKIQYVLPVNPQNGERTVEVKLAKHLSNSLCSLHSQGNDQDKQQEHSL